MTPEPRRPAPEDLLALANASEAHRQPGKLKLFFGANAGVGKTYAMLMNARRLRDEGVEVVVGLLETHGRAETAALLEGLERLPLREMTYGDRQFQEFDVDAALARRPAVLLVDELAHRNVPGSRHPKRWQDVEELCAAGIEVHSTLNVQHLESINDVVNSITGVRVWETVPDRIFDAANEVVLVDISPDDLLQRLRDGKVYMPAQAERAVQHFFRKGNLVALRELALRRTADRVDDEVRLYRRERSGEGIWPIRERLLACMSPAPGSDRVLRSASRMAAALNAEWHAVFVETPHFHAMDAASRAVIMERLRMAENLGAVTATIADHSVAGGLVKYALRNNVTKLVIGRSPRGRFWERNEQDMAAAVTTRLPDVDVVVVAGGDLSGGARRPVWAAAGERLAIRPYLAASAASILTTLVLLPVYSVLDQTNVAMLFLAALVAVAMRFGRGPATWAAFLNVLGFDVFFVEPRFSLAVSDLQFLLTFVVMLAVGLLIAQLTARLKFQVALALGREDKTREVYELARHLTAALGNEKIAELVQQAVRAQAGGRAWLLLPDRHDRLQAPLGEVVSELDLSVAQWSFENGRPAGASTDTMPGSALHYMPLKAPMRVRGVLAISLAEPHLMQSTELRRQLDTIAALTAIALERVHFVAVAQETLVQIESQRLRESLLAALSHDLRTPITAIVGIAEMLGQTPAMNAARHAELLAALHTQSRGMARLVANILDMARLESGQAQPVRPDWQSLEELVGAALRSVGDLLSGHVLSVALPEDFPLLYVDGVLLERVLVNLLENAAKYVPPGGHVGVTARIGAGVAEIEVWDDGPGLPHGDPEQLFRKFYRGAAESGASGVGLGLSICRAIVEAHGGTITASSRPGGGARFVVQLPLKETPALELEPPEALAP